MKIRSHLIEKQGTIITCASQDALTGAKVGKNHYWIDIDADSRDSSELRSWLRQLNLPPFLLEVLVEPPDTWASQVVPLRRAAYAVIRTLPENPASDEVAYMAALSMQNLLLTFTSCPRSETGGLYSLALAQLREPERLPAATSSGVLVAWLRFHVERTSRSTRDLRSAVLTLDETMDRDMGAVSMQEIIEVKDQLLKLLSVAEEQNECLQSLSGAEAEADGLDFSQVRGSFTILLATAGATERMALRLEKHIAELRNRYKGHHDHRMHRRLSVLTVLSAVFLPLTLVTGIWGMNFQYMPELQSPSSYPMALLAMLIMATAMVCFFCRTGWFE